MAKQKQPKVRIARPKNRPFQLRYTCPVEGREIRLSTGTRDEDTVQEQKAELEAKLLLGIPTERKQRIRGPKMLWEEFLEEYRMLHLATLRDETQADADFRLGLAARIIKPRTLGDMADKEKLQDLQARLLAGEERLVQGKDKEQKRKEVRPRSPHTVKGYMATVLAALNWAAMMDWLPAVPRIRKLKVGKLKSMKGRPVTREEFERMLLKVESVVGSAAAPSWRFVLHGIWESGLRLDELMHVSWDDANQIQPVWKRGALPVLVIPEECQKNATEEAIPLLPGFDALLTAIPTENRQGWVFNPLSLQGMRNRKPRHDRPTAKWVGRIISRIGKAAGIIVEQADPAKKRLAKFASAHDLRRSLAERMYDAGIPEREITRIMRHADAKTTRRHYAPGSVQKSAGVLRMYLGTVSEPIDVS